MPMAHLRSIHAANLLCTCLRLSSTPAAATLARPSICRSALHTTASLEKAATKLYAKATQAARQSRGGPTRNKPEPTRFAARPPAGGLTVPTPQPRRASLITPRPPRSARPSPSSSGPVSRAASSRRKHFYPTPEKDRSSSSRSGRPTFARRDGGREGSYNSSSGTFGRYRDTERTAAGSGEWGGRAQGRGSRTRSVEEAEEEDDSYDPLNPHQTPPTISSKRSMPPRPFADYSPPLSPALLTSISELLPPSSLPTPIQTLSLDYFFALRGPSKSARTRGSSETLLAGETGSGKTLAYLLPVLQNLKETEAQITKDEQAQHGLDYVPVNSPRALILAPTHELCRQIAQHCKQLTHISKLRTVCFSNPLPRRKMKDIYDIHAAPVELSQHMGKGRPADIVVGTPSKMLEMFRLGESVKEELDEAGEVKVRGSHGTAKGLERVQWVVVDEADVLFGRDFRPATRALLHFVREARLKAQGKSAEPAPFAEEGETTAAVESVETEGEPEPEPTVDSSPPSEAAAQPKLLPSKAFTRPPFNLLLSTATVSSSLGSQLSTFHPQMVQLLSPNLHRLPRTLRTEHVTWSSGNKSADVAQKLRSIWAEEARQKRLETGVKAERPDRGKVLVFCNTSSHAEKLGRELGERGIGAVVLTSESELRRRGSNNHLEEFLRPSAGEGRQEKEKPAASTRSELTTDGAPPRGPPAVLITTSLLSRGLDFSAKVKNVLIMDEPQNMVDFVHRAGRTARAGEAGKVTIFGRSGKTGESPYIKEMRARVKALA